MAGALGAVACARGHLFPLVPVLLGTGVGTYFALPAEPGGLALALLAAGLILSLAVALRGPADWRPLALALGLLLAGPLLASLRTHLVAAPVLGWHRYGPIEGRIVAIDRSGSDAVRLTLDQVVLPGIAPARVPGRVRISVLGPLDIDPVAGLRIALTGHLGPPGPPVEPGGFDFRRFAWFEGLGAVGYTRSPVVTLARPEPGPILALTRLRHRIADGIRRRIPGEEGGFVAAILTGDRSGVGLRTTEALRRSNLAHLLAISGLHMGLLTGVVYGVLRALLALVPPLALNWPIRRLAALGALAAAAAYLALSGGNVATQRAFVMAAVMLGAVMADRRAVSLRSVALAALVVLVWRPEAILSAGFQMSFAATVALVATFRWLRERPRGPPTRMRRWLAPVGAAVTTSLVAGLATAPFAAAQFHRAADYGLIANILSVPLMGVLVMPAAVLAAALWPLGLEGIGLSLMALGTRWILGVATWFGGIDGALRPIMAPHGWVIPALSLGALWLILWPARARWLGLTAVIAALVGWGLTTRPALLIDGDGALVGLMTPAGRALSRARGAGYTARAWLEADGDGADQATAALRAGFTPVEGGVAFTFDGAPWLHLPGRRGARALAGHCHGGVRIVTDARLTTPPQGNCSVLDASVLAATGAVAYRQAGARQTAHNQSGQRPWAAP
ncbi:MAG: ComEC/Rec2 family competence protein [Rhodobacter sp.]|nr:ComEC/Rec2 family competence protein [Rhodobacter sp.]